MTIIGKTGSVFKVAKKTTVWIQPVEGPVVVDNTFLFDEEVGIPTDAAGNFQVTLAMADYYFRVGTRRVIVSVDNTTNSYPLEDRIISDVVQLPTQPAGGNQPVASQAVFGIVKGDSNVANFIAVSGVFYVADYAAARLVPSQANNKIIFVADTDETFKWSSTSTAADDPASVLKPDDTLLANPGRWLNTNANAGPVIRKTTAASMLATASTKGIKLVCLTNRESFDYATLYNFVYGDVTPVSATVLAPVDGLGRYFALI
jgi:hypothetical protein